MNMDDSRVPTISGNLHMRTGMFAHMANFRHHPDWSSKCKTTGWHDAQEGVDTDSLGDF